MSELNLALWCVAKQFLANVHNKPKFYFFNFNLLKWRQSNHFIFNIIDTLHHIWFEDDSDPNNNTEALGDCFLKVEKALMLQLIKGNLEELANVFYDSKDAMKEETAEERQIAYASCTGPLVPPSRQRRLSNFRWVAVMFGTVFIYEAMLSEAKGKYGEELYKVL